MNTFGLNARLVGKRSVWSAVGVFVAAAFGVSSVSGQTVYYWDTNGTTSGFGTASGTWGGSSFFSTNASGTVATTSVTTTLSDDLNFGTATASMGLATGTISVSGSQSIRSLIFGSQSGVLTLSGGTIGLAASGTITANQTSNVNTIDSIIAGAATGLVKNGVGTAILTQANTYSGSTSVTAGTLTLGGANGSILSSANVGVTGATFTLDNSTSNNNDRLGSTATVTLNADSTLLFNGNGATASTTESFGTLGFGGGQATVTLANTGAGQLQTLSATSVSRAAGAVGLIRGSSLQAAATNATRLTIGGTVGTGLSFVGSGTSAIGASTAGTDKTLRIVPYLVGDTSATGNGSSFLTYDTNATAFGLRPLATNEYTTLAANYTTPATVENVNAFNGTITTASPTVNSLRFATASQTLNGSGTLTINSGAILVTANISSIGSGFSSVALGNGTWNEGVIQVTSGNTLTVNAPISVTGGGGLTKGLTGNLTLNAANTYTGDTIINGGNLALGASGLLGNGNYAGAVRAAGTVTLTNTASQTLAGGLSSAGLLTLNAPGAVSISGGLTTSAGLTAGASAGTIGISGPWTSVGTVTVPAGKEVSFANGTVTATAGQVTITGGGTFTVASGTLNAANNAQNVISNAAFNQGGGLVSFFNSTAGQNAIRIGSNSNGAYVITSGTLDAGTSGVAGAWPIVIGYQQNATTTSGTLTVNGATATVIAREGAGGGSVVFGWNGTGGGGSLNLMQGEIQLGSLNTYSSNSSVSFINVGSDTGSMTIRPYSGNLNLFGGANTTYTLTGNNAVIASSDQTGTARTVTVALSLGESGGRRNLEFAGLGTTTLNAANTYSGTTRLTSGTLALGNVNALQNSTLNVGGTVTFTVAGTGTYALGGLAGSTGLAIGGNTLRIGGNNDSTTYGGVVSGSGAIVKIGSGSLVLTGSNSYTGPTTIGSGLIQIGNGATTGALNAASAISGSAGASIVFSRSDSYGGSVANVISSPINLSHVGTGTLTLTGSNTYSGTTTISGGVVNLGVAETSGVSGPLGTNTAAGAILLTGGTLQYSSANNFDYSGRLSSAAGQQFNVDTNGRDVVWATGLAGTGNTLTKSGAGTLTLSATSSYTGDTVVNAGNLTLGANGLLGNGSYAGAVRAVGAATLVFNNSGSQTLSGLVSSSSTIQVTGSGSTTFTGGLTSTGLLTLNAPGAVSISGGLTTSAGLAAGANAGTTTISGPWTNNGTITVPSGKTLSYGSGTFTAPISQTINGGGTFAFASGSAAIGFVPMGSNVALLVAGNTLVTQSAGSIIASGGQGLYIGQNGSNGNYTITGGTLAVTGSIPGGSALVLAYHNFGTTTSGTLTIDGDSALVSVRSTAGGGVINWSWTGAANSFSNGTLNLARGELQYASEAVGGGGTVVTPLFNFGGPSGTATIRPVSGNNLTLSAAVTRTLVGSNGVINSTDGTGVARSVTVNGAIGESGGRRNLEFAGAGTTSLAAANTFSGTALLTGGTLALANRNALQNSTLNVGSTVTFTVAGTGTYALGGLAGSTGLAIGGNTLRIGANNDSTTYGGIVTGASGGLVKVGAGSLALTAVQAFTGATRISGGRLEIGAAGGINSSSGITIDGGDLRYNSATALTKPITFTAGTISGTGTIGAAVTVAAGDFLSPGNSPGSQSYTSLHAWSPGGTYQWELNALTGTAGTTWDVINVSSGTFNLSALNTSPGNQFVLDLITLDPSNAAGPLANPYDGGSYTFAIASYNPANFVLPSGLGLTNTAGTDLTGLFQISLGNWQGTKPEIGNISVKINSGANGIDLVIVPEPATLVLLAGGAAAVAVRLRRRRSCVAVDV